MLAMALWWLTEIIPLAATALVPLAIFPLVGGLPFAGVAGAYAHPLIMLFLGGFLIARAIEKWGLHIRVSAWVMKFAGRSPAGIVGGLMVATAFLSLWISNTASAMIMVPVAAAASRSHDDKFAAAALLGVAYAATIGGLGSLIGTPPNALFAAYMDETHGVTIGFAQWAAIGMPVTLVLLPVAWFVLTRMVFRLEGADVDYIHAALEPMTPAARRAAVIAILTALAWITRPLVDWLVPDSGVTDAGIAILAALALFIVSDGRGGRLLEWPDAHEIRWDVLILFGGGLALAHAIDQTGLAEWIADRVASFSAMPALAFACLLAITIVLVGELASNTAMAAIFLPIAGASAVGLGLAPAEIALPVALAASIGFMLPVATPPNAIVFAYEAVNRKRMLCAGAPLDLIGTLVAVGVAFIIQPFVF
jgi:sodium-dependent dicarboxylate transporter 2/3/5